MIRDLAQLEGVAPFIDPEAVSSNLISIRRADPTTLLVNETVDRVLLGDAVAKNSDWTIEAATSPAPIAPGSDRNVLFRTAYSQRQNLILGITTESSRLEDALQGSDLIHQSPDQDAADYDVRLKQRARAYYEIMRRPAAPVINGLRAANVIQAVKIVQPLLAANAESFVTASGGSSGGGVNTYPRLKITSLRPRQLGILLGNKIDEKPESKAALEALYGDEATTLSPYEALLKEQKKAADLGQGIDAQLRAVARNELSRLIELTTTHGDNPQLPSEQIRNSLATALKLGVVNNDDDELVIQIEDCLRFLEAAEKEAGEAAEPSAVETANQTVEPETPEVDPLELLQLIETTFLPGRETVQAHPSGLALAELAQELAEPEDIIDNDTGYLVAGAILHIASLKGDGQDSIHDQIDTLFAGMELSAPIARQAGTQPRLCQADRWLRANYQYLLLAGEIAPMAPVAAQRLAEYFGETVDSASASPVEPNEGNLPVGYNTDPVAEVDSATSGDQPASGIMQPRPGDDVIEPSQFGALVGLTELPPTTVLSNVRIFSGNETATVYGRYTQNQFDRAIATRKGVAERERGSEGGGHTHEQWRLEALQSVSRVIKDRFGFNVNIKPFELPVDHLENIHEPFLGIEITLRGDPRFEEDTPDTGDVPIKDRLRFVWLEHDKRGIGGFFLDERMIQADWTEVVQECSGRRDLAEYGARQIKHMLSTEDGTAEAAVAQAHHEERMIAPLNESLIGTRYHYSSNGQT